jgi:hypothetical protein
MRRLQRAVVTCLSSTGETQVNTPTSITPTYESLSSMPAVDIPANVHAALAKGRRATGIAAEAAALRFGPGRLSPQENFVYHLWDSALPLTAKPAFVGKLAQHPMHVAAGSREGVTPAAPTKFCSI